MDTGVREKGGVNARSLVVGICMLGMATRLSRLLFIDLDLPSGLGGLFLEFALQITHHSFRLPLAIPFYSEGGIPFAYPPLPFYLEAFLVGPMRVHEFVAANVLPPILSAISVPLFYVAVRRVSLSGAQRVVALLVYALMPSAFMEQVDSAGLSEACGTIMILLLLLAGVGRREQRAQLQVRRALVWATMWALCVVSSPGSAYASVFLIAALVVKELVTYWGDKRYLIHYISWLGVVTAFSLVLSAPYWLNVILHHRVAVFVEAFSAQQGGLIEVIAGTSSRILAFGVSGGSFGQITNALIFLGVIEAVCNRRWWLILWFLTFLAVPREGRWLVAIPGSILAAYGIGLLFGVLGRCWGKPGRLLAFGLVAAVLLTNGLSAVLLSLSRYDKAAWSQAVAAMEWIRDNTAPDSRLLVLENRLGIGEWAPHLTRRTVLNTWWGLEWKPEEQRAVEELDAALESCRDWDCFCRHVMQATGYSRFLVLADRPFLLAALDSQSRYFVGLWKSEQYLIGHVECFDGLAPKKWTPR